MLLMLQRCRVLDLLQGYRHKTTSLWPAIEILLSSHGEQSQMK